MRRVICKVMLIVTTIEATPERRSAEAESCLPPVAVTQEQNDGGQLIDIDVPPEDQHPSASVLIYVHYQQVVTVLTLSPDHQSSQERQPRQSSKME